MIFIIGVAACVMGFAPFEIFIVGVFFMMVFNDLAALNLNMILGEVTSVGAY
jgi:hypothetical protein